jgi:hypothetical protein
MFGASTHANASRRHRGSTKSKARNPQQFKNPNDQCSETPVLKEEPRKARDLRKEEEHRPLLYARAESSLTKLIGLSFISVSSVPSVVPLLELDQFATLAI